MFNLYDQDDFESVHSEEHEGVGADVSDAIDHYQQLEAERFADIALQAQANLDLVASQGLPLAYVRAQGGGGKCVTGETNEDRGQQEPPQPAAQ